MKIIKGLGLLALFSLAGAGSMFLYSFASLRGVFVKWENLGRPPSSRAIEVVGLGYVYTDLGEIYQHSPKSDCNAGCWDRVDSVTPAPEFLLPLDDCGGLPSLTKYGDSKAFCEDWGFGTRMVVYAIDSEGLVYYWDNLLGEGYEIIRVFGPFFGAVIGLLSGIFILLLIWFWKLVIPLQKKRAKPKP